MKRIIPVILVYFIFFFQVNSEEKKVFVKKKINELIITNIDIENEKEYIKILSPNLATIDNNKLNIYAENSLVNEKIKLIELSKFFNINDTSDLPEKVIYNFYKKLGFNNFQEFKNYIDSKGLDYQIVLNKLYLDHLWNSLIYNKYKNKITIDEESIKQKILEDIGKEKKITSFLLNEIVFSVNNNQELEKKSKEITNNINQYGFEDTAKLYSLSDSSKFGGELDWISENQMSKKIKNEILKTPIGNHTKPIKIADGYMILFVKDIKQQEKKINFDKRLAQQINYERNNQFKQFSRLYFKKLMVNQKVE